MTMEHFTAAENDRWKAIVATLRTKNPDLAEAVDKLRQYAADATELVEVQVNVCFELLNGQRWNAEAASARHAEAQLETTMKGFTAADNDRWKAIVVTLRAEDPVLAEAIHELREYAAEGAEVIEGLFDVILRVFHRRQARNAENS